jgi:hypothetical protein
VSNSLYIDVKAGEFAYQNCFTRVRRLVPISLVYSVHSHRWRPRSGNRLESRKGRPLWGTSNALRGADGYSIGWRLANYRDMFHFREDSVPPNAVVEQIDVLPSFGRLLFRSKTGRR